MNAPLKASGSGQMDVRLIILIGRRDNLTMTKVIRTALHLRHLLGHGMIITVQMRIDLYVNAIPRPIISSFY